ncbi:FimV/HubP family polar landmark protein [Aromatoleum anaerobium]|uniref:FimV/HubP family polar landmark protein n=1 Tax=Aromatoleum anaerobium TaxID=182180 RepID=UPI001FF4839D|nr:FimV/HubP family polar landmark protein [Aromatoleum anaerobium]MCK0508932.1 hypothetical protein [Aromatoleum anaerobium]
MSALKLAVESRGDRAVVRISSDRPLSDPFVDLLIELDWASGRVIREYTFLLDPAPAGTPPAVVAAPVAPAVAASSETQRAAPPSRPPLSGPSAPPARHEVRRGDTLHGIAEAHRPPGASLDQMLVALFHENPDAFEGENINRMRAGAILKVPSGAAVTAVEPAQAHRKVVAQAADFEAYRKRLAGTVAARAATSEPPASRAGAGAIVARVDEPAGQGVGGDQVKVSAPLNPTAAPAVQSPRLARLQSLEEELVVRDKALEEANSRLAALEASIREMQQLLEIRSEGLGELQQRAGGSTPDGAGPGASQAHEPAAAAPAGGASAQQPTVETQASRPLADESKPEAQLPAPKAAEVAAPVVEADFLQGLADDPKLLAAGGGILVLLLGYAGIKVRERRKGVQDSRDALGIMSELPLAAGFGAAGGQNVNTGERSILDTDFSQSGLSAIDTDEGVDPVAEADVYMAYGRDVQAEEILLDALKADTSRLAIPLKLLEIYARRNSPKQFEATASALHSRTGGVGQDWEKAAEMGRKIDPDNPLYGASTAASRTVATELQQGATASDTLPFAAMGAGFGAVAAQAGGTSPDFDQSAASSPASDRAGRAVKDLDFTTYSQDVGDISPADSLSAEAESALLKNPWEIPAGETGDKPGADASDITLDATELDPVVFDELPEIDAAALDFDLDVGLPWGGEAASASGDQDAGAAVDSPLQSGPVPDLDFLGEAGAPSAAEALLGATFVSDSGADLPALMPDTHFDLPPDIEEPVPDAGTTDFNLEATKLISGEASGDTSLAAQDPEETTFDSNLLDFDFNFDDTSMDSSGVVPALDPSSITLDEPRRGERGIAAPLLDIPQPTGGALSDEAIQEVDTKLELARAYEEMGDKEGARELIDEVLREGSPAQREAGKRLLEQLV